MKGKFKASLTLGTDCKPVASLWNKANSRLALHLVKMVSLQQACKVRTGKLAAGLL